MDEKKEIERLKNQPNLISGPKDIVDPNRLGLMIWRISDWLTSVLKQFKHRK